MGNLKKTANYIFTDKGLDIGLLILRVFSGMLLLPHGLAKIKAFDVLSTTFADPFGIGPKVSLILIICSEVGASILVMLGLLTRPAALVIMFGMAVAILTAHMPIKLSEAELPLVYLVIFTSLLFTGAGRYSLDQVIANRWVRFKG